MKIINKELKSGGFIYAYIRDVVSLDKDNLPCIIILPGGGYEFISDRESEPMALAFSSKGYQTVILEYNVIDNIEEYTIDYQKSNRKRVEECLEIIIENAKEWKIDSSKIVILGCSAGGHLVADFNNHNKNFKENVIAQILCYPLVNFISGWPEKIEKINHELKNPSFNVLNDVNKSTPQTFIWHTETDSTVPVENSLQYISKLEENNIKFKSLFFDHGKHGMSLATRSSAKYHSKEYIDQEISTWFQTCIDWLEEIL